MKKFLMIVLVIAVAVGLGWAGDITPPKSAPEVKSVGDMWQAWNNAKDLADKCDSTGDFMGAFDAYVNYVKIAKEINDPQYTPKLVEWGLNDQAYMLIKEHKKDQKGTKALELIKKAKAILDEAVKGIADADPACVTVINKNVDYVNDWLKILSK